jgi:FkbM family methyltransferase
MQFATLIDTPVPTIKVVDVGANPVDGDPPYAPLVKAGHADVVGFEPNPTALAALDAAKGPRETYLPHAIGDGQRHTLHVCAMQGMTSLLEPNAEVLALFHGFPDWGQVVRKVEMETKRLDDVPETRGLDYLKIDIQGAELMVFENAIERLSSTLVVHTEVEFLPLYKNRPLFTDIDLFLRRLGFQFHRFDPLVSRAMQPILVNNNPYAPFKQAVWADAVYVRSFLDFARIETDDLLKLAAILHDCYRSYDLAHVYLAEHDRRTGGGLGQRYLTRLLAGLAPAATAA